MNTKAETQNSKFDLAGIIFSIACLIHCLALPLLSSIIPAFSILAEKEWVHILILCLLIPTALFSFIRSRKVHLKRIPLSLGVAGIVFLVSALLLEDFKVIDFESVFTIIGSVLLVSAHISNWFFINKYMKLD